MGENEIDLPEDPVEVTLKPDELRALSLFAEGLTESQIARALAMSETTLRRAMRQTRGSLGANSTINAVYLATKRGLI